MIIAIYLGLVGLGIVGIIYELYKDKGRGNLYVAKINRNRKPSGKPKS